MITLCLDDQEILRQGDPVQGASSPLIWSYLRRFDVGSNGHFYMQGEAFSPSLQRTEFIVADITAGTVLIDGFDFLPRIPRRLEGYSEFSISASGDHWSASVVTRVTNERFILVDGEVYEWMPGYLLLSRNTGTPIQPPGSQGLLCLGGLIGRLQSSLFTAGLEGTASVALDLLALPQPMGPVSVLAGETWHVQGWFRDAVAGAATSNFTAARSIEFR